MNIHILRYTESTDVWTLEKSSGPPAKPNQYNWNQRNTWSNAPRITVMALQAGCDTQLHRVGGSPKYSSNVKEEGWRIWLRGTTLNAGPGALPKGVMRSIWIREYSRAAIHAALRVLWSAPPSAVGGARPIHFGRQCRCWLSISIERERISQKRAEHVLKQRRTNYASCIIESGERHDRCRSQHELHV